MVLHIIIAGAKLRQFCGLDFLEREAICVYCCSEGINVMKRKLAEHDNLKVTIEQTGDKFHIKESSTFRTKDIDFTLGVPFDYSLADGTEVSVSVS